MPDSTAALGQALIELADATESYKGPMVPPDLDITSFAHQELKEDATLGNPATIEKPVYDVLAHLELLFNAACDQMRSLGSLLINERPSWFGYVAVTRAVVETSCRQWHIADTAIGAQERVHRHLLEWQYELRIQRNHIDHGYQGLPPAEMTALQQWVDDKQTHISDWAASQGFALTNGGLLADSRLSPTEALIAVLDADPTALGQGGVMGAYHYNRASAVAHGLPSGVAMYHEPAAAAGGHAHNVLTPEHVGHVVQPAIVCFDAAFDRLAVFFRWPHGDLVPLRYQAIHEVGLLVDPAP